MQIFAINRYGFQIILRFLYVVPFCQAWQNTIFNKCFSYCCCIICCCSHRIDIVCKYFILYWILNNRWKKDTKFYKKRVKIYSWLQSRFLFGCKSFIVPFHYHWNADIEERRTKRGAEVNYGWTANKYYIIILVLIMSCELKFSQFLSLNYYNIYNLLHTNWNQIGAHMTNDKWVSLSLVNRIRYNFFLN